MNNSFTDEFLAKFLMSQDFSAKNITVKLAGLSAENRESVSVCLERRERSVVVFAEPDRLELVGDMILAETFECAVRLKTFKANDLAKLMALKAQNANNRLKRLVEAGALRRSQVTGSTRGGKEYSYQVVTAEGFAPEQTRSGLTPAPA